MIGLPSASNWSHRCLICPNCASRSACASDPLPWGKQVTCLYLSPSGFDRIFGDAGLSCHQDNASALFGFQRQKLSPLLLIEQLTHPLIFFPPILLLHVPQYSTSHLPGQLV